MKYIAFNGTAARMLLAAVLAVVVAEHARAGIPWHDNLVAAKTASAVSQRPLLVIFTASWSEASDRFVQTTLATPEAVGVVSACFEAVRLDVDMNPELAKRLRVTHMPTACVIDTNEQLLFRFECSDSNADFIAYTARAIQYAAIAKQSGRSPYSASLPAPAMVPSPVGRETVFPSAAGLAASGGTSVSAGAGYAAAPPSTLPQVSGGYPAAAASYPTTTFPAPAAPPVAEKPKPKNPLAAMVESSTAWFKRPAPKKDVATEPSAVPPPQVLASAPTPAAAAYGSAPVTPSAATPLGLEGYCPVTLMQKGAWVEGNAQWGARHRGRTYLFAGPVEQQAFFASPDRFAPALAGDDPVLALDAGRQVPGERRYGLTFDSRIYLFSSAETLSAFTAAPEKYTRRVVVAENASRIAPDTILR